MSNRVGVIFHENWVEFSPLMYSHHGAGLIPFQVQDFLRKYYQEHNINHCHDGHQYNPCHMMVGFLQSIDKDIHVRVENLTLENINILEVRHEYDNCFDGGCWIVNVSQDNYGETVPGDGYYLDNDNIFIDELRNEYDLF